MKTLKYSLLVLLAAFTSNAFAEYYYVSATDDFSCNYGCNYMPSIKPCVKKHHRRHHVNRCRVKKHVSRRSLCHVYLYSPCNPCARVSPCGAPRCYPGCDPYGAYDYPYIARGYDAYAADAGTFREAYMGGSYDISYNPDRATMDDYAIINPGMDIDY